MQQTAARVSGCWMNTSMGSKAVRRTPHARLLALPGVGPRVHAICVAVCEECTDRCHYMTDTTVSMHHTCRTPENTFSAGPVINTWLSASRHSMCSGPPGRSTLWEHHSVSSAHWHCFAPARFDAVQHKHRTTPLLHREICTLTRCTPDCQGSRHDRRTEGRPADAVDPPLEHACNHRCACAGAAGQRPARAALPHHHAHVAPAQHLRQDHARIADGLPADMRQARAAQTTCRNTQLQATPLRTLCWCARGRPRAAQSAGQARPSPHHRPARRTRLSILFVYRGLPRGQVAAEARCRRRMQSGTRLHVSVHGAKGDCVRVAHADAGHQPLAA